MIKKLKLEPLFYMLLSIFVAILILSESQFIEYGAVGGLIKIIKYVVIGCIAFFLIVRNKLIKGKLLLITIIMIVILTINMMFNDGGLSIIPLLMLAWLSKDYSLDKTFKCTFITIFLTYAFVIVCSVVGILEDDVQFIIRGFEAGDFFAGEYNRHSMGFLVHNQVAIAFFVLYMLYIAIRRDKIRWYESLVIMILNFLILRFFGSRIVFVLIVLTCAGYYIEREIQNHWKSRQTSKILIFMFPICCILSFFVAVNYSRSSDFFRKLDLLLSNRVRLSNEALSFYGIHLFGAGQYAGTYNSTSLVDNTVDNGYIAFFIQNGLIVGIIIVGIWTYIAYITIKNNNRYVALSLIMIAIENMVNPHMGFHLMIPFFCIAVNKKDAFITNRETVNGVFRSSLKLKVIEDR